MPKPRRQFYPRCYRKYLSVHTVSDTADMDDSCDTDDSRHHGRTDFRDRPLVASAAPFVGRMVESSLSEIDGGVIEAAQSMGSSSWQIIYKVLIPEAKPSLLIGAAISVTTILGYSAMAGIVGGGGLGAVATNYGLYRYDNEIMLITIIIIVVIVQIFQEIGMITAKKLDKRLK